MVSNGRWLLTKEEFEQERLGCQLMLMTLYEQQREASKHLAEIEERIKDMRTRIVTLDAVSKVAEKPPKIPEGGPPHEK